MARPKYTAFVSPIGRGFYAFVDNPAKPFKEGDEPKYKVTLAIDDNDENRAWVNKVIETGQREAKANGVKLKKVFANPFVFPEDQDEDDFVVDKETGKSKKPEFWRDKILFTAASKYQPARIDTARVELPEDIKIMSGDDLRVKVELNPYEGMGSGISLRLKTVQLIAKNTSFSGGKADTEGFDDVDGYRAPGVSGGDEEDEF